MRTKKIKLKIELANIYPDTSIMFSLNLNNCGERSPPKLISHSLFAIATKNQRRMTKNYKPITRNP
ncbi:MAG: hypothetical protein AAFR77_00325 [Cyanobacteria bacterium J06631_2]